MSILVDPYQARSAELGDGWDRSPLGLLLPQRPRRRYHHPVAVDLFSGAGGFGCGFHQAGWHVAAASEMDMPAALTYMLNLARPGVRIHFDTAERQAEWEKKLSAAYGLDSKAKKDEQLFAGNRMYAGSGWISGQPANHPGCEHFFVYDIHNLTGQIVLDALGLEVGEVDCVFGGPPCQGFSAMGKRNIMDPRNSLVFEFARLICEIMPKTFVMENVPGMASMVTPEGIPVLDAFAYAAATGGYADYEALKTALGVTAGKAKAGIRGAKKQKPVKDDGADPDEGTLFAAAATGEEDGRDG